MNTVQYMAAVKAKLGIQSDYALAKSLGITRQSVSGYSNGYNTFGDDLAMKIADILDIPRGIVLLDMLLERAKTDAQRDAWKEISKGFPLLVVHANSTRATARLSAAS